MSIGPKIPRSYNCPSVGPQRTVPWIGDFDPFDYEVETMPFLPPSLAPTMSTHVHAQSLEALAASRSPKETIATTIRFADTSTKELTALSPAISMAGAKNLSACLPMMEIPHHENQVPLAAPRKANSKIFKQRCTEPKRVSASSTVSCDSPGCTVQFSRKKDQNRHFRLKHQANGGFQCPILDCSIGTGHSIQRRDKLREHLRRKGDETSRWQCILPGCAAEVCDRSALIDHLGHHDRITRLAHQQLLIDYCFITGDLHPGTHYDKPPLGYLTCTFICDVRGCPFGTNSHDEMKEHSSTPHVGALCPCPMSNCEHIFQDWATTSAHLARRHDADDRKTHEKELLSQGFWWRNSVFTCPICKVEIKILLNKISADEKVRSHCSEHSLDLLRLYGPELVSTFSSSNRRRLWYPRMPLLDPASDEQVFAYLTRPKENLLEIWNSA